MEILDKKGLDLMRQIIESEYVSLEIATALGYELALFTYEQFSLKDYITITK